MAGLFDDVPAATNDPAVVLKLLKAKREQQKGDFESGATSEYDRYGRQILSGLQGLQELGAFGKDAQKAISIENDPQYKAIKQNADLAAKIQAIKGDPSSAEFASQAAEIAKAHGREDLALTYREAAGNRRKAEAATAYKMQQDKITTGRQQFSALPTAAQEELVAENPQILVDTLGLDPMQAATVSKNVAERNAFQKAKLAKQLEDVGSATTTKTTNADVNQIKAALGSYGIDQRSFGLVGDNTEEFDRFATPIAAEVQRRMDIAKDRGGRANQFEILGNVVDELKTSGAISTSNRWFSDSVNIDEINPDSFRSVFSQDTEQTKGMAARPTSAAPAPQSDPNEARQAAAWIKANPNDPRVPSIKAHYGL